VAVLFFAILVLAVSVAPAQEVISETTFFAMKIMLETVATEFTSPVKGTVAPGLPGYLFVVDQAGTLWAVNLATGVKTQFLNISARLVTLGVNGPDTFDERGFLGVAFNPWGYALGGYWSPGHPRADGPLKGSFT
jgi:hypothetical protein